MTQSHRNQKWIRRYPNPEAGVRLFCLPFAGGSAVVFHPWPAGLPSLEVCAVELPGRGSRFSERPMSDLKRLVAALATGIMPYLDKPYALFGYSLGAVIAFELAQHLRHHALPAPVQLLVAARRAPHLADIRPPIYNLPEAQFLREIHKYNGTPMTVFQDPDLRALFLPVLRADFQITDTYICSADDPLDCPITAFGGLQDETVSQQALGEWGQYTRSHFALHMFEGDHFFLKSQQRSLLAAIEVSL